MRTNGMTICLAGPGMALGVFCTSLPAPAAVRMCHAPVSSGIVHAPSQREAKTRALAQWRAGAAKTGDGFDSWRLAAQKSLECFRAQESVACIASGQPCIIVQNPKRLPAIKDTRGRSI